MKVVVTTLNAKYIHTCLALRCLKAFAEPDFPIEMVEYTIKDPTLTIVSDLYDKKPDVIGFSCYIWNIEETMNVIDLLKKVMPETKIILGGPEVSYDTKEWLDSYPSVDFVVIGEGEETFKQLLEEITTSQKYHMVFGVAYRKGDEVIMTAPRPKLKLNEIPSPYRFAEDRDALSKRVTYFETSRGCPYSCQFCLSSIEIGVRYSGIDQVKADLLYLIESGAKLIKFVDRTFNIKRDYALEIFQFLIENHNGCIFQFEITADIMRPEVLEYLNEHAPVGIFRFEIGVQSTNDTTNELVMRRQNFEKLTRTVRMVKDGGKIAQHLDLIAGLPEEDYHSFRKTFNDVFALRPEEMQLGFLKMLRGTGLRINASDHDYIYMDNAPYEILSNNVLSFDDVIRIKRVEDVLEKYWNDHRMDRTILYLVENEFDSAFDFFQEFGDYWTKQGWSRIGHQLEDLFDRLDQFLTNHGTIKPLSFIRGIMKVDFFENQKHKPRKTWWTFSLTKEEQSHYINTLTKSPHIVSPDFSLLNLNEKEMHKHTMIEAIPFSLSHTENGTNFMEKDSLLFAHFNPKEKQTSVYTIPMDDFKSDL